MKNCLRSGNTEFEQPKQMQLLQKGDEFISTRVTFGQDAEIEWTQGEHPYYRICSVRTKAMLAAKPVAKPMKFVFSTVNYCYRCRTMTPAGPVNGDTTCKCTVEHHYQSFREIEYRRDVIQKRKFLKLETSTHDCPELFECHSLLPRSRAYKYWSYAADPVEGDIDHAGWHSLSEIRLNLAARYNVSRNNICFFSDFKGNCWRYVLVVTKDDVFVNRYEVAAVYDEAKYSPEMHFNYGAKYDEKEADKRREYRHEREFHVTKVDRSDGLYYSLRQPELVTKKMLIVPPATLKLVRSHCTALSACLLEAVPSVSLDVISVIVDYCVFLLLKEEYV